MYRKKRLIQVIAMVLQRIKMAKIQGLAHALTLSLPPNTGGVLRQRPAGLVEAGN